MGQAIFVHDPLWGDSGKGKVTDYLTEDPDITVVFRYQGGNNAGHTVKVGDQVFKTHLLPTAIIRPEKACLLGNGVVIDPGALLDEMQGFTDNGFDLDNLKISPHAHLVMPYHPQMDHLEEEARPPEDKIGTTRRGIGPCYADKMARCGIRLIDALDLEYLENRINNALIGKRALLEREPIDIRGTGLDMLDVKAVAKVVHDHVLRLKPHIADTTQIIWDALDRGEMILGEGAQSVLLDIDHGTYPFVTSSNCLPAAASAGIGLRPQDIGRVIGVVKAYPTRVDTVGAFPSKLAETEPETEDLLIERGHEFGATTGRRRRCGWNDILALRYAVRVSGISELAITKMDVMYDIDPLKLCVGYRTPEGEVLDRYPADHRVLATVEPIYKEYEGFTGDISGIRDYEDLPEQVKTYLQAIGDAVGVPVTIVGVGMGREQMLVR